MVLEFSDYQCPFCARADSVLATMLDGRPELSVLVRQWPLVAIHPRAEEAARMAVCAARQGVFEGVHRGLYAWAQESGAPLPTARLDAATRTAIDACVTDPVTDSVIGADSRLAVSFGARGTPSVFFRGRLLPPSSVLSIELLQSELERR